MSRRCACCSRGRAFDRAVEAGGQIFSYLESYGRAIDLIGFCNEMCAGLPEEHERYHAFLGAQSDTLLALGLTHEALAVTQQVAQALEKRTKAEPNRADYQRDLSVPYEKMGNLLRALGQGDEARGYYQKSFAIRERLAAAEPNRADYQRDLLVSYNKLGDLLRALGQGDEAQGYYEKSLAIAERLAAAEPNRADYQRDLSVSYQRLGYLLQTLGQLGQAQGYYEKYLAIVERLAAAEPNRADYQTDLVASLIRAGRKQDLERALGILEPLEERGALTAEQQGWPDAIRQMLDGLAKGERA